MTIIIWFHIACTCKRMSYVESQCGRHSARVCVCARYTERSLGCNVRWYIFSIFTFAIASYHIIQRILNQQWGIRHLCESLCLCTAEKMTEERRKIESDLEMCAICCCTYARRLAHTHTHYTCYVMCKQTVTSRPDVIVIWNNVKYWEKKQQQCFVMMK